MKVLVVGDRPLERSPLRGGLARFGVEVVCADPSPERVEPGDADLVLYDLGASHVDPLAGCRRLRVRSQVPVMVVAPTDCEEERIEWFEVGADQFAVEPVGTNELVSRMRAATRRACGTRNDAVLRRGRVMVDTREHRVCVDNAPIDLTPREYDLLALLVSSPDVTHTRRAIFDAVWGEPWASIPTKTVVVHISQLRRKLGHHDWIETCPGGGYRLGACE
jgi:DNA-binding response OmpR family regulator